MSLSKIRDAEKSLTKKEDANEELVMMLAPRLNWVEQICPAPMAVNAMGQLALLSCKAIDFELNVPSGGYKSLRYSSFKPNLMQVCNAGHNAFQKAHVNMDAIRQATNRLPVDMKQAVQILVKGNSIQMEKFLPKTMDSIKSIADSCLVYAEEVKQKFIFTQDMIEELLEVCFSTKGATAKEKDKLALLKTQSENSKILFAERKRQQEKEKKRIGEELEKRTRDYDQALKSMPSGWEVLGMTIVENLAGVVTDSLGMLSKAASGGNQSADQSKNSGAENNEKKTAPADEQLSQVDLDLLRLFETMPTRIVDLIEKMEVPDKETGKQEKNDDTSIFTNFETLLNAEIDMNMPSAAAGIKSRVTPVLNKLKSTLAKQRSEWSAYTVVRARKEMSDILDEMVPFGAEYKAAAGNKAIKSQTPHTSTAAAAGASSGKESATQAGIKNAQFKVTQANEMMKHAEKNYDNVNEQLLASNDKLNSVMEGLARIDSTTMSYNEILKVLKKGLIILGELKEKWSTLTVFFSEMVNLIDVSMNKPMMLFLEYAKSAQEVTQTEAPMDKLMCDLIYSTAREAVAYGYVVNRMSSGYHDISTKYLMGPVSTLARMMTLDNEENKSEIMKLQVELNSQSIDAQDAIKRQQKREHENFKKYMEKKMLAINGAFADITSELPDTEKREIENQVRDGMDAAPVQMIDPVATPVLEIDADDW